MDRWVEISFDCLPLRSVGRLDIPMDASPKYQQRCERIKAAMERHGSYNSYFLYNAKAIFHLTNDPQKGWDGTFLGKFVQNDNYVYHISYINGVGDLTEKVQVFTLIR